MNSLNFPNKFLAFLRVFPYKSGCYKIPIKRNPYLRDKIKLSIFLLNLRFYCNLGNNAIFTSVYFSIGTKIIASEEALFSTVL